MSDVSDAELLERFRAIGQESIQRLILQHLRSELDRSDLELSSRVFPRFPQYKLNTRHATLNRVMVTTCMYKIWSRLQELYPCIHDYKYVAGDVDFVYLARFPYIDIDTHETYGVETVLDFAEFAMDAIQVVCFDTKSKLRQQMEGVLKSCSAAGSECSDASKRLLHVVTAVADSAVELTPPSLNRFETKVSTIDYNRIGQDAQAQLQKKFFGVVETQMHKNMPESAKIQKVANKLKQYGDTSAMKCYAAWAMIADIVQHDDEVFELSFGTNCEAQLDYIASGGMKYYLDDQTKKKLEGEINDIIKQVVEDGSVQLLSLKEELEYLDKHPFSKELRCCQDDNGKWKARVSVEVVGKKMRVTDLDYYRRVFMTANEGPQPQMFFQQPGVQVELDVQNMPHARGQPWDVDSDPERVIKEAQKLLNIPFSIGDEEITHDKMAEMALSFVETFYGNEPDIDLNNSVSALILLGEEKMEENPEKLAEFIRFVGENLARRERHGNMEGKNGLARAFNKAYDLVDKAYDLVEVEQNTYPIATLETIEVVKGVPRLKAAVDEAYGKFIASHASTQLEEAVAQDIINSEFLREHLNSEEGRKKLQDAKNLLWVEITEARSVVSWWGRAMRRKRHGFNMKIPLNLNIFTAMIDMFSKITDKMYDEEALNLFSNICLSTAYKPLVNVNSRVTYTQIITMMKDIDVALQLNLPRWTDFYGFPIPNIRPMELDFFQELMLFIGLYATLRVLFSRAGEGAKKEEGFHVAVFLLGWYTERMDMVLLHLIYTGIIVNAWNWACRLPRRLINGVESEEKEDDPVPFPGLAAQLDALPLDGPGEDDGLPSPVQPRVMPGSRELNELMPDEIGLRNRNVPRREAW